MGPTQDANEFVGQSQSWRLAHSHGGSSISADSIVKIRLVFVGFPDESTCQHVPSWADTLKNDFKDFVESSTTCARVFSRSSRTRCTLLRGGVHRLDFADRLRFDRHRNGRYSEHYLLACPLLVSSGPREDTRGHKRTRCLELTRSPTTQSVTEGNRRSPRCLNLKSPGGNPVRVQVPAPAPMTESLLVRPGVTGSGFRQIPADPYVDHP